MTKRKVSMFVDRWRGMQTVVAFFDAEYTQEERYQVLEDAKKYGMAAGITDRAVGTHWGRNYVEVVFGDEQTYQSILKKL